MIQVLRYILLLAKAVHCYQLQPKHTRSTAILNWMKNETQGKKRTLISSGWGFQANWLPGSRMKRLTGIVLTWHSWGQPSAWFNGLLFSCRFIICVLSNNKTIKMFNVALILKRVLLLAHLNSQSTVVRLYIVLYFNKYCFLGFVFPCPRFL